MATSPRPSIDNELASHGASAATMCQVSYHQWPDLFTITSKKFAECSYCAVNLLPIITCLVLFYRVTCHMQFIQSYKLHPYIHTFIQPYSLYCHTSYTHTSIHSYNNTVYSRTGYIHTLIHSFTNTFIC